MVERYPNLKEEVGGSTSGHEISSPPYEKLAKSSNCLLCSRGVHSLLYFAYTCVRDLFIWRVIYLAKKILRWWYFTCKKPEIIICDGILHVNMFPYFRIPYSTCTFFTKFTYNEYIGPYFLSHVASDLPELSTQAPHILHNQYPTLMIMNHILRVS
jgi:hypothetical protein